MSLAACCRDDSSNGSLAGAHTVKVWRLDVHVHVCTCIYIILCVVHVVVYRIVFKGTNFDVPLNLAFENLLILKTS